MLDGQRRSLASLQTMTGRRLALVAVAACVSLAQAVAVAQQTGVLHVKVAVQDAERRSIPVARHTLLVSDNPASGPPHRIVTASDGTVAITLAPGSYIVESDRPFALAGKGYQWTQVIDIVAGRDTTLELTAENAEAAPVVAEPPAPDAPRAGAPSLILDQWQSSVIELWTPTAHATGFVAGANGLVVTNQRVVGAATSIEAQISPTVKVAARVVATDSVRDITVLWIDKTTLGSARPVPMTCGEPPRPAVAKGQEIVAVEAPFGQPKDTSRGTVESVVTHAIISDITLDEGSEGSPVFRMDGALVGMATVLDEPERRDFRVVPIADVCDVMASAQKNMNDGPPPSAALLPIEPVKPYPIDTLDGAVAKRAGSLNPYQIASSDFDIAFLTPVLSYAAQQRLKRWSQPSPGPGGGRGGATMAVRRPPMDFANWSDYVATVPPVLLIRVTPKLVEGFWAKVARGAAQTQGMSLPPLKRFKSGFARLRAFCGDSELTPIHPFKLEHRVSNSESIYEGLYVFDPGAITPECSSVKLMLYSEKEPDKPVTQVVDARVIKQVWQDFDTYRAQK
jgi:S1-C subfamily serine protease